LPYLFLYRALALGAFASITLTLASSLRVSIGFILISADFCLHFTDICEMSVLFPWFSGVGLASSLWWLKVKSVNR